MTSTRELDDFADALESIMGAVCQITTLPIKCYAKSVRAMARACHDGVTPPAPTPVAKGAKVVTKGGIYGTVTDVDAQWLTVEISKGVAVRIRPSHVEVMAEPKKAS